MQVTRRGTLLGAGGVAVAAALGAVAVDAAPARVRRALGLSPDLFVPDAAEGEVRLDTVASAAMGTELDLFTAVPAGYGEGAGLPALLVLHGASSSAAQFRDFGFTRFVTAAVEAGAPPFVLVGTDDGPDGWVPGGGVDPFTMLREEMPQWLADRGFAPGRPRVWAWSRGGYGALRLALTDPGWARALALFSPAVADVDPALADLSPLTGQRIGVWCGTEDPFLDDVRAVTNRLPTPPEVSSYVAGGHTQQFWNEHALEAFSWLMSAD
ncbi:esterase [Nocardioides sp. GY 10113]|uniref:alpha/beta hydrolase-fold protein n=1 Tax=Nocardioides sp. GY 10113 TaxID=2569761 RepID=UPI0010A7B1B4|nr:alpha/beta hydrolase-fold protein [Nocardioides sp. GY 10113]TIC87699.1 esterase [Nocardioides sp. GY 10113]